MARPRKTSAIAQLGEVTDEEELAIAQLGEVTDEESAVISETEEPVDVISVENVSIVGGEELNKDIQSEYVLPDTTSSSKVTLGVHQLSSTAKIPEYATKGSACFDLCADFTRVTAITVFNTRNQEIQRVVRGTNGDETVVLDPGDRAMVPTNLIFDIPEGYKILVYPRSGISLKKGLRLANTVGIIDQDYVDPAMVLVYNASRVGGSVTQGERIAQAELVPVTQSNLVARVDAPGKKTTRNGGFGSTGV